MIKIQPKIIILLAFLVVSLLYIGDAHAASAAGVVTGIDKMFANSKQSWIILSNMVASIAKLIGLFLVVVSIFKFSDLASDPRATIKVPLSTFLIGVMLFMITSSIGTTLETLAMGSGPGSILVTGTGSGSLSKMSSAGIEGVLYFIRFLGYVAFVRGWLLINAYANSNGNQGGLGKGLTHIFGGAAAINVQVTAQVLAATFAPGMSIPGISG